MQQWRDGFRFVACEGRNTGFSDEVNAMNLLSKERREKEVGEHLIAFNPQSSQYRYSGL